MPIKCAYGPCRCMARPDDKFCSDYCEKIGFIKVEVEPSSLAEPPGDPSKVKCGCGHANCAQLH